MAKGAFWKRWLPVLLLATAALAAAEDGPPPAAPLRIVTFNVRYGSAYDGENDWEHRKGVFLECLGGMRPDILCTQECLPFQADAIKERLPWLDRFGLGRYHGVQTNRTQEFFSGEHCFVFYDVEKFALEKTGTFWLSDAPDVAGSTSWGTKLPRIVTWGILRHRQSGRRFSLFNTHLDGGEDTNNRSVRIIQARIDEISWGLPVVLTGDFNATPDSETHWTLTGGLADAWSACGKPEEGAGTSHGFKGLPKGRIDWILFSTPFEPVSIERIDYNAAGRYPSDHFPVMTELRLQ